MFDLDRWREIFQSIRKNKLRSVMSGFTIAFAILLFTLLFGVANGLGNFFKNAFADNAQNMMFVRVWKTTKPYKGLQTGRKIQLKNKILIIFQKNITIILNINLPGLIKILQLNIRIKPTDIL